MTLQVVEVGEAAAGYAGRLFGSIGARVLRLAPRRASADSVAQAVDAARDVYLDAGKRVRPLSASTLAAEIAAAFDDGRIDVLVVEPALLDAAQRQALIDALAVRPPTVRVDITPFGTTGPYANWRATGSVLLALGGYSFLVGDPDRAPLTLPGHYVEYQSGQFAFTAALAWWLRLRDEPRMGTQRIDVSMWETVLSLSQFTTVMWTFTGELRTRHGNDWASLAPLSLYRCADGYFVVNIVPTFWGPFTRMLGRPELERDPRFATNDARMAHKPELNAIIDATFGHLTMAEVLELGQRVARVPTGPALDLDAVLADPHLGARGAWDRVLLEDGATVRVPAVPFRHSRRVPCAAQATGVASEAGLVSPRGPASGQVAGPLAGLRILDFTHVWAGPLATRILADLGAEVTKVEAPLVRGPANQQLSRHGIYPRQQLGEDPWNRQAIFNKLNRNKLGVAVDLKQAEGRAFVDALVPLVDVVFDNFSATAMDRMGFSFDALIARNPRVLQVTMPGFGRSGPFSDFVAYGPSVEPMAGFTALLGYGPSEPRLTSLALPDAIAGVTAAAATVAALYRRAVHGETGLVECSLHEGAVAMLGDVFVAAQRGAPLPRRLANRHPVHAPHGIYRCAADDVVGDDAWICIAITSDDEWRALIAALRLPADAAWQRVAGRRADQDRIDALIEQRTRGVRRIELMAELQQAGVPAGAVAVPPDQLADAHLRERGFYVTLGAPHIEPLPYPGLPIRDGTPHGAGWRAAPAFGEHNAQVALNWLGWSAERLAAARASGALLDRPPATV